MVFGCSGGIERQSKKCFFEIVEDRSAKTLIPIITKYVKPGTVILSDCWKAYSTLKDEGYTTAVDKGATWSHQY